jgi:hypothetical protein
VNRRGCGPGVWVCGLQLCGCLVCDVAVPLWFWGGGTCGVVGFPLKALFRGVMQL